MNLPPGDSPLYKLMSPHDLLRVGDPTKSIPTLDQILPNITKGLEEYEVLYAISSFANGQVCLVEWTKEGYTPLWVFGTLNKLRPHGQLP